MRFLKPLLAGATLIALAVPALASADSYYGGYHNGGYDQYGRGDRSYGDYADRGHGDGEWRGRRDQGRDYSYRDQGRGYGYQDGHRDHWRMHFRWNRGW
jgi:hypothetical protein